MRAERRLSIAALLLAAMSVMSLAAAALHAVRTGALHDEAPAFATQVQAELARRGADWYDQDQDTWRRVEPPWWVAYQRPSVTFDAGGSLAKIAVIAALLVGVMLLAVQLGRHWQGRLPSRRVRAKDARPVAATISDLPFSLAVEDEDPARALEQALAARDWRRALIQSYAHQLARSAEVGLIRLHKSKSNRGYQRELRRAASVTPELAVLFDRSVAEFERVYFGAHVLQEHELVAGLERYRRFLALLEQRVEAAA